MSLKDRGLSLRNISTVRGLDWLTNQDPAQLDPLVTPFATLHERYVIVLLYFATNGDDWYFRLSFLAATSVCGWNDGNPGIGFDGVACNEQNSVNEITLGKASAMVELTCSHEGALTLS